MKVNKHTAIICLASLVLPFALMSFSSTTVNKDFYKSQKKKPFVAQSGKAQNSAVTITVVAVWTYVAGQYVAAAAEVLSPEAVTIVLLAEAPSEKAHFKSLSDEQLQTKKEEMKMAQLDAN